jgi:hypothetical protein
MGVDSNICRAGAACRSPRHTDCKTTRETADYSYNIMKDPVGIPDLNATILYQLGIDHAMV